MDTTCQRLWSRKFLNKHFTQAFLNGKLLRHRENILFDDEKQSFPEAIEKIARLKTIEDDFTTILSILEIKQVNKDVTMCHTVFSIYNLLFGNSDKLLFKLKREIPFIDIFIMNIHYYIEKIVSSIVSLRMCDDIYKRMNAQNPSLQTEEELRISKYRVLSDHIEINRLRDVFSVIIPVIQCRREQEQEYNEPIIKNICPLESCEGVLDEKWYCVLCGKTTCSMCLENKDDENHMCNKDTVESVKLMKTDTKACPKCKASIFKIDGCDQMWCTRCHTAFSWTTGKVEKRIHNPHYYEWLRSRSVNGEIPRTDGDIPRNVGQCDEIELTENHSIRLRQNIAMYIKNLRSITANANANAPIISEEAFEVIKKQLYRFEDEVIHVIHLREAELRDYSDDEDDIKKKLYNFIMKMNYLNKKINEKEYKRFLGKRQAKREMNVEMRQLIQTWIQIKTDVLRRFIHRVSIAVQQNQILEYSDISYELDEMKVFIDSQLREIRGQFYLPS